MIKKLVLIVAIAYSAFTYDLTLNIKDLRDAKGEVIFSLYNKENSIPDQNLEKTFKQLKSAISDNKASVTFNNLDEGTYCVNILHDENQNGKIDKGFMLPVEGIGFTNMQTINMFNKPTFKKASFVLDKDETFDIKVIYF